MKPEHRPAPIGGREGRHKDEEIGSSDAGFRWGHDFNLDFTNVDAGDARVEARADEDSDGCDR
jgi:hypothetical protein